MRYSILTRIVAFLILLTGLFAQNLSIQGVARDNTGQSLGDANYGFTFRLYTGSTGGSAVWTETQTLYVLNGVFTAVLGDVTSMAGLDFNVEYWLSLQIDNNSELSPRTKLILSPYSIISGLNGVDNVFPQSGNVGIGIANPLEKLHVSGNILVNGNISIPIHGGIKSSDDNFILQSGWDSYYGDYTAINTGINDPGMVTTPVSVVVSQSGLWVTKAPITGVPHDSTLFRVNTNGWAGIGTFTPAKPLHVNAANVPNPIRVENAVADYYDSINTLNNAPNNTLLMGGVDGGYIGFYWKDQNGALWANAIGGNPVSASAMRGDRPISTTEQHNAYEQRIEKLENDLAEIKALLNSK